MIPGYVAQLSGEFKEELGDDWEVVIGTREAADLPKFLKSVMPKADPERESRSGCHALPFRQGQWI